MRAERLLALLMLLKAGEPTTATQIAAELGVSVRTVLRDIDSLSLSGVPVYAERGRAGGFGLLPGYRTDLTGLTAAEATSLLAGTGRLESPVLAAALRKVAAALPQQHRAQAERAAQRVLVRPEGFVRAAPQLDALAPVQQAVFAGLRIKVDYRRLDQQVATERILDPVGLIAAGDVWYLVANHDGAQRIYRISRIAAVEVLAERARRSDEVDLEAIWQQRRAEFRGRFEPVEVVIECAQSAATLFELVAQAIKTEPIASRDGSSQVRLTLRFGDRRRAETEVWTMLLHHDLRILTPQWLAAGIAGRATDVKDAMV